jgi:hypothetical protein
VLGIGHLSGQSYHNTFSRAEISFGRTATRNDELSQHLKGHGMTSSRSSISLEIRSRSENDASAFFSRPSGYSPGTDSWPIGVTAPAAFETLAWASRSLERSSLVSRLLMPRLLNHELRSDLG